MRTITIQSGTLLPRFAVVGCWVILLSGIYQVLLVNYLTGAILSILGAVGALSKIGVYFEFDNNRFRKYTEVLFIKTGEWMRLSDYPDMVLIRKNMRANRNFGLVNFGSTVETYYDACLATASHLRKIPIARFSSEEEARSEAPALAERIERNLTAFNPQVSSRSRARR